MIRKFFAFFLCLALLCSAAMAETTFSMAGYDGEESTHVWSENAFFTRMEKKTGLTFTYQEYTSQTEWKAAKQAMFNGGELPDVLFKASLTSQEQIEWSESGLLIDLLPLLEENAPNLWKLFQEHPDWLKAVTLPSGKVVSLPCIQTVGTQNCIWINKAWLEKLGLDVPTDWESFVAVLTAFRDKDPNGNGKQDEIPLGFIGPWDLKFLSSAYGVVANDYNIYVDDEGKVNFWPLEDSFFELASALRTMYADGLLESTGFATSSALRSYTVSESDYDLYGAFFSPTPVNVVDYDDATDYVVLMPFEYNGKKVWRDIEGDAISGAFAITSACSDPAAVLRWIDTLYSEEGAIEAMAGIEGEDYTFAEDGTWNYVGGVSDTTYDELTLISLYDTGCMPWMFPQSFYDKYEEQTVVAINSGLEELDSYTVLPFPYYMLTSEELAQTSAWQNTIAKLVDETFARMVLGQIEINDATKTDFINQLNAYGLQDFLALWQNIADRSK